MVKKKDEIPDWVTDEIQNAKFEKTKKIENIRICFRNVSRR